MKFGLRNMEHLLEFVGNPERSFPSIHVAGTNGKGSTSAFLASILMEAGSRTGLYTSPHLVRFTERIRINGKEISDRRLVAFTDSLRPAIEDVRATFFEATTCIAFQYFADEDVDIAVVEAGLGGRLDSTNVLRPLVSVITNVGLDHTEILGKTLTAIAREKGGIIKPGVPCITGATDSKVLKTLGRIAASRGSLLYRGEKVVRSRVIRGRREFTSHSFALRNVQLGLNGQHQMTNACVALAVVDILRKQSDCPPHLRRIRNSAIRDGLKNVVGNTGLRGRLENAGGLLLDVAHNPPGIRALVQSLGPKNLVVVFGVMKDKDSFRMLETLAQAASLIIAVAPKMERALNARTLYRRILGKGIPAAFGGSVSRGLVLANKMSHGIPILVTGSHYVVGEALRFLGRKKA